LGNGNMGYTADIGEELKLYPGEVKIISVNNPTRIAIGNPEIADVIRVTKNEITLSPKNVGTTNLVVWDNFGEQSYKVRVFAEDIHELKRRIDNMLSKLNLPEVFTQAEEEEGKVILLGRVKNPQDRERIAIALGALKEKTIDLIEVKEEEAVVEIDVQVLELTKDATRVLGLVWPSTSADLSIPLQTITESTPASSIPTKFSTLFVVEQFTRTAFTWKLDALVNEGKARILSRPRLACQSGKEAELLVGGEKPIFTTEVATTGTEGTEVDYKEYGIKLKIRPTVTGKERIKLALNVEVSEIGVAEYIGPASAQTAKAYPLTKRSASTELFLNDGETMAIGGLMKQKTEEDIQKTPGLGDLPILGALFRRRSSKVGGGSGERGDVELFITLTPRIISAEKKVPKPENIATLREATALVSSSVSEPIAAYAAVIQKRILENLTYPASARQAGFQGRTLLSLRLSYKGELLEVKVKSSSGYSLLDENALSVAQAITSYPPFPPAIKEKELWIEIPIEYRLD
ncbi:MAG: TonB family protein, partial [Candidatus Omnitrophica bacterium]|nr:TonB family protein [Candidatus Omnitrophota bacterium]